MYTQPLTGLHAAQVGPFLVTQAFYPLLKKRETRTIVNVTSVLGSVSLQRAGNNPLSGKVTAYTSSKAALNMRARPAGLFCCVVWHCSFVSGMMAGLAPRAR